RHAVDGGVLKRHGDGFRIDIEAGNARSGPELDRRDGQNAGSRSDIEQRSTLPVFFEHLQTPARGFVCARAESHPAVYLYHDAVAASRLIASTRRADEQALAYGDRLVAFLPFGQPILVGDGQSSDPAEREFGQADQLQVAKDAVA